MKEREERELREQLETDEAKRDRSLFSYTVDALMNAGILSFSIWPESNSNVAKILKCEVEYNDLPMDELNEYHKGNLFTEQQDIIMANWGKEPLCEALDLQPCQQNGCELYNSQLGPPICREFKIVFKKG
jgi:hypothetical protein